MIAPELIEAMAQAGVTAQQIAATVKHYAALTAESRAEKREQNRIRQQNHRERNASSRVTERDTPALDKEKSPTPPKEIKPSPNPKPNGFGGDRDFFSEFMVAYPRREGSNPRKPANVVFQRLVAKGVDPERLIAAAQTLAREHPTPTRFVPQAVTFLNQERFTDSEPVIPGDTFCPEDEPATRWHLIRFHNEHDGADPPRAAYGGKAGYLIPATWVKAMQMRQANG